MTALYRPTYQWDRLMDERFVGYRIRCHLFFSFDLSYLRDTKQDAKGLTGRVLAACQAVSTESFRKFLLSLLSWCRMLFRSEG